MQDKTKSGDVYYWLEASQKEEINLTEFGHVFKERNEDGGANPEVKEWAESVMKQITEFHNQITRDYVLSIEN